MREELSLEEHDYTKVKGCGGTVDCVGRLQDAYYIQMDRPPW